MNIITDYNSKKYPVGSIHKTINSGEVEICGKIKDHSLVCTQYVVKFKDGTIKQVGLNQIKTGAIQNKNDLTLLGIGFIGEGVYKSYGSAFNRRRYNTWSSMIYRCYSSKSHKIRPTYKDCTVNPRWHNFQNFCHDIKLLDGYHEWANGKQSMQLDKDIKIKGNKEYSRQKCMFVSPVKNMSTVRNGKYEGRCIETGEIVKFDCISSFSRDYKLNRVCVNRVLNGYLKSTKGWVFKKV